MPTPTASTIGETPMTVPTTSSAPSILQEGSSPTITDATSNGPSSVSTPPPQPPASGGSSWRRRTKRAPQRLSQAASSAPSDEEDDDPRQSSPSAAANNGGESSSDDVERFDGKIVYNPDGSAYIIEDSELSDDDGVDVPQLDGCIVDGRGSNASQLSAAFPQIANAFYVTRNPAGLYNALYGQAYASLMRDSKSKIVPEVPVMHSYRVYTVRDKKEEEMKKQKTDAEEDHPAVDSEDSAATAVPIKPILMCFICKLSFGYAKSFVAHAMSDHSVALLEDEKEILAQKNASAIIQCVGKEKEPLVSFLERVAPPAVAPRRPASPSVSAAASLVAANAMKSLMAAAAISLGNEDNQSLKEAPEDLTRKSSPASSAPNRSNSASPLQQPPTPHTPLLQQQQQFQLPPPPLPQFQSAAPPNFLTGTTIGVCPDHLTGRPSGVECSKCEMILASSRLSGASGAQSGGGLLAGMHSRNSCKTLKCPKCNWHYKYQETLEIHMKEKHPESETSCIYCIAGQPHPRLARGETYTCGYKPYRCEVCNYSTTTKGNLSIHMQSDKHLNNMQELQNGGVPPPSEPQQQPQPPKMSALSPPAPTSVPSSPSAPVSSKPKPTFRCDVCNYETNVARNLRIHMTSEKHTHNMMVLQQNVKHMQQLSALQSQMAASGVDPATAAALLHFHPALQGEKPPPHTEAALADMAYNQALLIQMMTGGQLPPHVPPELAPHVDMGLNPDTMEPPPEPPEQNPSLLFQCCVCTVFATDSLEALSHHLAQDRTKLREQEILALVGGNYVCKLCTYKTNLKANFQLHCKTDKHLQRLQHVNHIKEGGARNEWKLKYVSVSNPVQVRCHACDYYTNSAHKLQLHAAHQRHEISRMVFRHLGSGETTLRDNEPRIYHCALCGFSSRAKLPLLQHVRSMKHLQMEQLHQLQRRSEGKEPHTDIGEVFQVVGQSQLDASVQQQLAAEGIVDTPDRKPKVDKDPASMLKFALEQSEADETTPERSHNCPFCTFTSTSEMRIQAHVLAQHAQQVAAQQQQQSTPSSSSDKESTPTKEFLCPLCQDVFKDRPQLEKHVMQIHSVNAEGLQRLLMLVEGSHWLNATPESSSSSNPQPTDLSKEEEEEDEEAMETDEFKCQTCSKTCANLEELCQHQCEAGHLEMRQTPNGAAYPCVKRQCGQLFASAAAMQNHFRDAHVNKLGLAPGIASVSEKHVYKYRCNQCSLAFKTMEKLQLHSQYHLIRDATKCMLCSRSFRSVLALHKHVETAHTELSEEELMQYKQSMMSNPLLLAGLAAGAGGLDELLKRSEVPEEEEEGANEEEVEENDSNDSAYKEQQFLEDYLNSQAIAEDSYNDPNRKYKCHRCKVAFTRQSYLTSHNKTLLHRKGEKLSYPMEKYLDPNRPYKCDVCKESFTQKNILLVHYNSVSHLHKLKRAMQEQHLQTHNNNNNNGLTGGKDEDDKKPYKCNICKVAYSQGSTLDIHMRSVLHQTRASKLQELAITGQIDLSRPLIEQPDLKKLPSESPKQDITRASPNSVEQSPNSSSNQLMSPLNETTSSSSANSSIHACPKCSALFSSSDQLQQHQQLYCMFGPGNAIFNETSPTGNKTPSPVPQPLNSSTPQQLLEEGQFSKMMAAARRPSQMYKHLLESYGFELVMQFNENHQRRRRELIKEEEEKAKEAAAKEVEAAQEKAATPPAPEAVPQEEINIPEVAKSTCQHCKKEFSSVWVLKAHCEEVHKDLVPQEFLEKYAQQFKNEYENKRTDRSTPDATPEKDPEEAVQPKSTEVTPTNASTPTASSTPASSTDSIPNMQANMMQQMNEMQAALNAMAASQLQQLQFNPMMMGMASLGMGLPLGLNMNALAAMNLQPPLVPMMMPPPFDPLGQLFSPMDQQMLAKQQQMMGQQQSQSNSSQGGSSSNAQSSAPPQTQQKRARTRITDDQLKILRAHFDINNSPSEEAINEMAGQSGLPPKVIKHWFRNTLFKERQRNKDSPYNFNNPPSTTLNLEEYEKTGEAKVVPLSSEEQKCIQQQALAGSSKNKKAQQQQQQQQQPPPPPPPPLPLQEVKIEPKEEKKEEAMIKVIEPPMEVEQSQQQQHHQQMSLTNLISQQLEMPQPPVTSSPSSSSSSCSMTPSNMLPPPKMNFMGQPLIPPSVSPSSRSPSQPSAMDCYNPQLSNSNGSNSSGCSSSGKRANRTRFTDYQIKVLQEFFENNAYPKDDDLEYLSKLLSLSPRVIVVWFQNARQKARKVYENQPPVEAPTDDGTGRFQRTPGLNYQCKKCLLVFQRYYELIRHQKTHCFKEEDAKRSAQAQAAAAQIAAVMSSEDSNSSAEPSGQMSNPANLPPAPSSLFATSPVPPSPVPSAESPSRSATKSPSATLAPESSFQCDKCNLVFPRFDLWREHQLVHLMNPNLFPTYPPDSPFGILQQHALHQQQQQQTASTHSAASCSEGSEPGTPTPMQQKRKMEELEDEREDHPKDKRLRTTILPEQLDYLYQKYQIESNPSRKMLENIAREVGLKKRVVQVWFQNTRARERKGQFRAHAQVINKRCPFCPALFKVKSALESHLVTKHADQCTRGEINIDALPDEELSMEEQSDSKPATTPPLMPPIFPPFGAATGDMENSLKKYYEESMKRYLSELQAHSAAKDEVKVKEEQPSGTASGPTGATGESPLDLSKPVDLSGARPLPAMRMDGFDPEGEDNQQQQRNYLAPSPQQQQQAQDKSQQQMLQMAGLTGLSPPALTAALSAFAAANNNKETKDKSPEEMALLQQLYGMAAAAQAAGQNNLFLHPGVFPNNEFDFNHEGPITTSSSH
ncbi:zinc finger homeobox protein 4 isoform X2 [Neocloeon triangulifer]|uniref:zinc finger homeobox protein 4 isoform X2 n=1 Tax=Neocloeon triangulifer TaxID=2078957 RepID=UPI00286F63AE|nr:zinc finger homeobox protein 4 isoform X2 [Neocloeon triangulifer]